MSTASDESDVIPECIQSEATDVIGNLLPERSKEAYMRTYNDFNKWKSTKGVKSVSESVLLVYKKIIKGLYQWLSIVSEITSYHGRENFIFVMVYIKDPSRNMSFSGKKFRRTRYCNVHEMLKQTKASPQTVNLMLSRAPVFSFIRLDDKTFIFKLILPERVLSQKFRLGEEFEMEKHNGTKVKVTYTMEGEDVLNQVIKHPDGKVANFRREFGDTNKMTITMTGMREPAVIYYEVVE